MEVESVNEPGMQLKRGGRVVPFDLKKIELAIAAAGKATGQFDEQKAERLAERVLLRLAAIDELDVECDQDNVERTLMETGYYDTARAYIVYRERHGRLRRDRKTLVDVASSMN